ncbi:MAG: hypothetical protein E2O56_01055 [Gammaproteobacteria bacterium]|nr:MAG: hypothetical protein E2O56_01055 [Gammaproteobacteria bacterium]
MNTKSFAITVVVLYVLQQVLGYLMHQVWLTPVYEELAAVFRPRAEMDQMLWIFFATSAVWVLVFTYIFVRGREGKGIMEGVRYGALMGLFYNLTIAYDSYVIYPITSSLALKWFLGGIAISIILGVVASLVYKPSN